MAEKKAKRKATTKQGRAKSTTGGSESSAETGGFFHRLHEQFAGLRDTVASEIDHAARLAREHVGEKSILDKERLARIEAELEGQMGELRKRVAEEGAAMRERARRLASDERVRAAADVGVTALHGFARSLRGLADQVDRSLANTRPYRAGESVLPGLFLCRDCNVAREIEDPSRLEPCAGCGGRTFRRVR